MNAPACSSPLPTPASSVAAEGCVISSAVSMPRVRLMKAQEFEAQLSGQAIRRRAEAHADQIVKDTLVRAAEIEAAARVKGEQIGLQRYAEALASLEDARNTFARDAERQLIASVFSVVRQLLPMLPGNLITEDIVMQLIRSDARSRAIRLIVPVAQIEYARSQLDAWRLVAGSARGPFSIEVTGDAELQPDVCILKSEFGSVTATLSQQLAALEKSARNALEASLEKPLLGKPRSPARANAASSAKGADDHA